MMGRPMDVGSALAIRNYDEVGVSAWLPGDGEQERSWS